jgi:glycosyltransferase involved in cell wall biosynthesis
VISARVAILTNIILPDRKSLYRAIGSKVGELRVFLSSPSAAGIPSVENEGFQVTVQKSANLPSPWIHPIGFTDSATVVLPLDTGRQLAKYKPDVVISGECGLRSLQSAAYCLRQTRCPLVLWATLSEHTETGRGRLRAVARRWLFKRAAAVFVNGKSGRRYVEALGCDSRKVTEVPYTVATGEFRRNHDRPACTQAKRLLYVGQLIERKGILPFVENLGLFCTNNPNVPIELSIVGAGPLEQRLRTQTLGGRGTIRFLAAVPYGDLPAVYASADIFVFPTLADEWGLVVNEAMASGLPVLGSIYSQAVEDLVEDEVTGWKFRPDHRNEVMSRLCESLSASPEQLTQMGTLAAERISRVTPDAAAEQLVSAIAKLL